MRRESLKLTSRNMCELFKPARLEIYESLQVAGPSTIAELAQRLGRPADSLYYHVRKMLAIGVIKTRAEGAAARSGPGRRGAVYAVVAKRLEVDLDPASRRSREAWAEGGAAVLRLAQRDFAKTLESGEVRPEGPGRNLFLRRIKARLTPAQLKKVNAHLDALIELLAQHTQATEGELQALTCVMTPLEEKSHR